MTIIYLSSRGGAPAASFEEALLSGLAPDGGLYAPSAWPDLAAAAAPGLAYAERVRLTLSAFAGEQAGEEAAGAFGGFHHPEIAPLREIEPGLYLLELFHGPTAAFKDLAMQVMARLVPAALARRGERLLLFTATSGDTGAAAVAAFAGAPGVSLCVLHPKGRVSPIQRRQMTTTGAANVLNLEIAGDFDDCQRLVKTLLADATLKAPGVRVSSVNSINWGRLAAQLPYYQAAAGALGPADYVIPTGNLGDAFAGWAARACGAPMGTLTAAVNDNAFLADALATGRLSRRPAVATPSVSMDVAAPSNLERLVFEAGGRDAARTRALFEAFATQGEAALGEDLRIAVAREMGAVSITADEADAEMRRLYQASGLIVCPHTAVGLAAARRLPPGPRPRVVLATAHPAKFAEHVTAVLGVAPAPPPSFAAIADAPERFTPLPADYAAVRAAVEGSAPSS